ncbi:MAG: ABC transporter ATP-binding protein, partial [Microcoleus sp. PH2017_04_SCI_O_A]|nr:ABC transporter ATP-binding protein [Microcoleus sp. PH2017_04_SCI_O_A]
MSSEPLTLSKTNPVLAAQGLTRRFGGLVAVNDVSFTVEKNEIFGLIGPNGAGKTTLFNVMTGLIPASSGNLIYQNENISQLKPYQIANKGIARTFQNIRLFGDLSVLENVAIARHIHSRSQNPVLSLLSGIFGLPESNAMERKTQRKALELLDLVGLGDRAQEQAKNLPYGDQRRLEIARALALEPQI